MAGGDGRSSGRLPREFPKHSRTAYGSSSSDTREQQYASEASLRRTSLDMVRRDYNERQLNTTFAPTYDQMSGQVMETQDSTRLVDRTPAPSAALHAASPDDGTSSYVNTYYDPTHLPNYPLLSMTSYDQSSWQDQTAYQYGRQMQHSNFALGTQQDYMDNQAAAYTTYNTRRRVSQGPPVQGSDQTFSPDSMIFYSQPPISGQVGAEIPPAGSDEQSIASSSTERQTDVAVRPEARVEESVKRVRNYLSAETRLVETQQEELREIQANQYAEMQNAQGVPGLDQVVDQQHTDAVVHQIKERHDKQRTQLQDTYDLKKYERFIVNTPQTSMYTYADDILIKRTGSSKNQLMRKKYKSADIDNIVKEETGGLSTVQLVDIRLKIKEGKSTWERRNEESKKRNNGRSTDQIRNEESKKKNKGKSTYQIRNGRSKEQTGLSQDQVNGRVKKRQRIDPTVSREQVVADLKKEHQAFLQQQAANAAPSSRMYEAQVSFAPIPNQTFNSWPDDSMTFNSWPDDSMTFYSEPGSVSK